MYRQKWDDGNGNPRTNEPHFVDDKKWVGNEEIFVNFRGWDGTGNPGPDDEKSRTRELDSTLMFLGCMEVRLKIKFLI